MFWTGRDRHWLTPCRCAMESGGAAASADRPLAWLSLEADRSLLGHGLTARYWPGGEDPRLLATAHAHGAWMDWRG
jgi:hypothetical protein